MALEQFEIRENTIRREMDDVMELPPHDPTDWHEDALCRKLTKAAPDKETKRKTADIWFSEVEMRNAKTIRQTPGEAAAADICFECPVRKACLKYACDTEQEHGTWGGLPIRRIVEGKHDFEALVEEPNPFDTDDTDSHYNRQRLQKGAGRPRKIKPTTLVNTEKEVA